MVRRLCLAIGLAAALLAAPRGEARAAGPFVDAPLVLPPLRFSADAGIGFGTSQAFALSPTLGAPGQVVSQGTQVGWGTSLEAAIGLPFLGELGFRVGYRFDGNGIAGNADHFARLFDPILSEPGASQFTNPEIRLLGGLINEEVFQLGLETRLIIPTDSTTDATGQKVSYFALTPGVPMRVHVPGLMRIDTGLYLPVAFDSATSYSLDVPVQAFFRIQDAFVGPVTGVRYNAPGGGIGSTVDIPLGIAGGYTLAGRVDLKAQLRTERVNDANWASQYLGGGLGVGLRLP